MKRTSKCCNAPAIVQGFTTRWYECVSCRKPCDLVSLDKEKDKPYKFDKW